MKKEYQKCCKKPRAEDFCSHTVYSENSMCTLSHKNDKMHKACTKSVLPNPQHRWRKAHELIPLIEELWTIHGDGEGKVSFLLICGPEWLTIHAPGDGCTLIRILVALSEVLVLIECHMKLDDRIYGEDWGEFMRR